MTLLRVGALAFAMSAAALLSAHAGERSGAYASLAFDNPQACAHACEEDSMCVAWAFRGEECAQFATAPQDFAIGPDAGLSPNAPRFIRAQFAPRPDVPPQNVVTDSKPQHRPEISAEAHDEASLVLLGGPEEGDIRSRLQ
jgi:hypothetical protein